MMDEILNIFSLCTLNYNRSKIITGVFALVITFVFKASKLNIMITFFIHFDLREEKAYLSKW